MSKGDKSLPGKEEAKARPDFSFEEKYHSQGCEIVFGIDEAGRGPLAGPVVAAAVLLPHAKAIPGLNDSKKLTEKRRELLYAQIMESQEVWAAIGVVEAPEIDELNILRATHLAMKKAAEALAQQLGEVPGMCLIDGLPIKGFPFPYEAIVKGDARSLSISAASIVAKVTRDGMMKKYAEIYPEYGFEKHSGYGTKTHLEALKKYGATPIHRRSFAPVAQTSLPLFPELD